MLDIKIVVGSNFGDEGKGATTNYFASKALEKSKKCLVVCHNGGSQKGHTVKLKDGTRHVFHHFGSGTLSGADTYLADTFILNPIIFRKEYEELKEKGVSPICFVSDHSFVTTPFDMLINQIVEEERGNGKHGSCGYGIFETIKRHEQDKFSSYLWELWFSDSRKKIKSNLKKIRDDYLGSRFVELGYPQYKNHVLYEVIKSDDMLENWLDDFIFMKGHTILCDADDLFIKHDYECVVFEGAQGLLLDQNNAEYMPHLTPSNTGIKNPAEILKHIKENEINVEACYITRSYLTRHGAGRFDGECDKVEINAVMFDETNVSNPFQDTLRYGRLDVDDFIDRINKDSQEIMTYQPSISVAITHLNETNNEICCTGENMSFHDFVSVVDSRVRLGNVYLGFVEEGLISLSKS